jgi:hypothetical protein
VVHAKLQHTLDRHGNASVACPVRLIICHHVDGIRGDSDLLVVLLLLLLPCSGVVEHALSLHQHTQNIVHQLSVGSSSFRLAQMLTQPGKQVMGLTERCSVDMWCQPSLSVASGVFQLRDDSTAAAPDPMQQSA